jgi:transcription initiation factor TFIIIB Brf1 subunit/transcription initiation factor TFIIB
VKFSPKHDAHRIPKVAYQKACCFYGTDCQANLNLFLRKFEAGEVRNYTVKFTYSYLAKSLGKGFRVPNVKTVIRHIIRLLELPLKFVTQKVRSHIEEIGVNGIALTLHPSVIFFVMMLIKKPMKKD